MKKKEVERKSVNKSNNNNDKDNVKKEKKLNSTNKLAHPILMNELYYIGLDYRLSFQY